MKRVSFVTSVLCVSLAALATVAVGQASPAKPQDATKPAAQDKAPAATEKATVVFLGNATCPGDSKPVNRDKFVEVDGQRIYVCSDECVAALKKDASAAKSALAKAYPTATPIEAKKCCCGEEIDAAKAVDTTFQGHKVKFCCADCVKEFKKSPVTGIALLMHPDVKDAKNPTDPIDDKPIEATIVGIYKTHLIHFASWANAAAFEKDPAATIAKLKLSS
jgi:YHS domain-containing protein